MTVPALFPSARGVIVAIDHPMYMWPTRGLEDRGALINEVVGAGADGIITTYGTLRDFGDLFGSSKRILKLDTKALSVGTYQMGDHVVCWTLDDAANLGADAVLTFVQVGLPDELPALAAAARVASACDRVGLPFLCEIMPIESPSYPDAFDAAAIAACARAAAELGAHAVKTSIPNPPEEIAQAVAGCELPIFLAGGDPQPTEEAFLSQIKAAVDAGASGVAVGRNVWAGSDPAGMVKKLAEIVHGPGAASAGVSPTQTPTA
jgi:DhnA family fructose-bisphosphate aldolase class Ia